MDILLLVKTFILGLVEGATEFLPISSTGHLIIVGDLLHFNDDKGKVFEIVIQLAAILAVCWEYRRKLIDTALHISKQSKAQRFVLNLFLAFLPAAILGLAFHSAIKQYLFSPITVAIALIVGGFAILWIERLPLNTATTNIDAMKPLQALKVGFAQSLALFPGVSRAGATILGGMICGLDRKTATEFSFFLAIPIMFAAAILDVYKSRDILSVSDAGLFALGFVTAFLSALVAIRFLLRFVATHDFKIFAWYRIVFGTLVLVYFLKLS
ncbi:MAG: undecaprenyl-diphosphate phosphatase [Methylotenera sp.]|nr:undecaprenyl-diphosphate phosphatase [Methylotenera sp.]MSQ00140.1 undecaprenyl-diphosphate phosphatase [Methylotenera sp.]